MGVKEQGFAKVARCPQQTSVEVRVDLHSQWRKKCKGKENKEGTMGKSVCLEETKRLPVLAHVRSCGHWSIRRDRRTRKGNRVSNKVLDKRDSSQYSMVQKVATVYNVPSISKYKEKTPPTHRSGRCFRNGNASDVGYCKWCTCIKLSYYSPPIYANIICQIR